MPKTLGIFPKAENIYKQRLILKKKHVLPGREKNRTKEYIRWEKKYKIPFTRPKKNIIRKRIGGW